MYQFLQTFNTESDVYLLKLHEMFLKNQKCLFLFWELFWSISSSLLPCQLFVCSLWTSYITFWAEQESIFTLVPWMACNFVSRETVDSSAVNNMLEGAGEERGGVPMEDIAITHIQEDYSHGVWFTSLSIRVLLMLMNIQLNSNLFFLPEIMAQIELYFLGSVPLNSIGCRCD